MRKTVLGRTNFEVTQLGYGALEIKGTVAPTGAGENQSGRMPNEDRAGLILNAVLDGGINFIDTAWCYGRSEELMGKYIAERRNEFVLAAKAGHGHCAAKDKFAGFTRADIVDCLEESLENLKTDHLDILQLHNPTPEDIEENGCIEVLQELKSKGLTKFIGVSSVLPHLEKHLATGAFDVFQIPYSALEPEHHDIITKIADQGAGIIIRGGVAKGEPGMGMGSEERWDRFERANLDDLREESESRTAFLLRFTMSHPNVHTIIVGTQNPDHLKENIETAKKGALSAEIYNEAKSRLRNVGLSHGT